MIKYYERKLKCCGRRETALSVPLDWIGKLMADNHRCYGHRSNYGDWVAVREEYDKEPKRKRR